MQKYTSSQAAKKIGRSIQTLQSWEREGLINPKRDDRGWRYFMEDDIKQLIEIKKEKLKIKLEGRGGKVNV